MSGLDTRHGHSRATQSPVVVIGETLHKPRHRGHTQHGGATLAHYAKGELPLKWWTVCSDTKGYVFRYSRQAFRGFAVCEECFS